MSSEKTSRVLFLCTGNSCRSQMAEAIVNARHPEWRAFSAGTQPTGFVHPMAIQVLREIGIEHNGSSKSVEQYRDEAFDLVVTVCDDANESCPVWLGKGVRLHEGFRDPARAEGTDDERLAVFRQVRSEMLKRIPLLLK
jgi:arsenate reductase (thioredoxin)